MDKQSDHDIWWAKREQEMQIKRDELKKNISMLEDIVSHNPNGLLITDALDMLSHSFEYEKSKNIVRQAILMGYVATDASFRLIPVDPNNPPTLWP